MSNQSKQSKIDDARLRRAKKFNVATSTSSGLLGVGALGALAASRSPAVAAKIGRGSAKAAKLKRIGDSATVPLSAASLGVGGVGSLNFARVQNQEANRLPKFDRKTGRIVMPKRNVSKADRRRGDYSGAATGAGAALAGGGAAGTGVFQYRVRNHKQYLDETGDAVRRSRNQPGTKVDHYWRGVSEGKLFPERQVIRQLKTGRAISGAALVGGAALAGAGISQRRNRVSKARKRDFAADAAVAGGATVSGGAGATSLALNAQGRKWSARASETMSSAERLNRRIGGHSVRSRPETAAGKAVRRVAPKVKTPSAFTGVPMVIPHKSSRVLLNDDKLKAVLAGRSKAEASALGSLRGAADQHRYFAEVYGQNARMLRRAGKAGAAVAAAGLGAKAVQAHRDKVKKSMSYGFDVGLSGVRQGENIAKRKDWMNISEHERRARDARKTQRAGGNISGIGGTLVAAGVGAAALRGRSAGTQAINVARGLNTAGRNFGTGVRLARRGGQDAQVGRAMQSASGRLARNTVRDNPYGSAVLGGIGTMGAGAGVSGAGYLNEKRHNRAIARQRKARVRKSLVAVPVSKRRYYDPEERRKGRLETYQNVAAAGAGAAGVSALRPGREAVRSGKSWRANRSKYGNVTSGLLSGDAKNLGAARTKATHARRAWTEARRATVRSGGKAGALGAAAIGLGVGADQIRRYKNNGGRSWNERQW